MEIAVLGTGVVGHALAGAFIEAGHDVSMGARDAANEKARAWASSAGERARAGTFADAAGAAEVVVNATAGVASLDALHLAGAAALAGKVLIDVANPLDFSHGMPPTLTVCNTDSLAEQIQRAFPETRVVKTLNTVTADVMVAPARVPGDHTLFVCGDDADAKATTSTLLRQLGWPEQDVVDLGGLGAARGMEMYLPLWVQMMGAVGHPHFNIRIVRGA